MDDDEFVIHRHPSSLVNIWDLLPKYNLILRPKLPSYVHQVG